MSTRRKLMWIGISITAVLLVAFFTAIVESLGVQFPIDTFHRGVIAGRLIGIIVLFGLIWIITVRPKHNK